MDNETRAAFAAMNESITSLRDTVTALDERMTVGFAQVDRFFELQQLQHVEVCERLDLLTERVDALTERVDALTERVVRLENQVTLLRDHFTREIAEIRVELRALHAHSDQTDELRRQITELTVRVDRLERRSQG